MASPFSQNRLTFVSNMAGTSGLDPGLCLAWTTAEFDSSFRDKTNQGNQNWMAIGGQGAAAGQGNAAWQDPATAGTKTAEWIKGTWSDPGFGKASSSIQSHIGGASGKSVQAQIQGIHDSDWCSGCGTYTVSSLTSLYNTYKQYAPNATAGGGGGNNSSGGGGSPGTQFAIDANTDYWAGCCSLTQQAQLYFFSDAETMYLIDGKHMVAQQPCVILDRSVTGTSQVHGIPRYGIDSIPHMDFTYDNSAFQGTSTHKRKGTNLHQTALAKVQSPTEGTVDLICPIDYLRAGDTVMVNGAGLANGIWILGDITRSVFSVQSSLTLVPAMAPLGEFEVAGAGSSSGGGGTNSGGGNPAPGATWGRLDMGFDGNYDMQQGAHAPFDGTLHITSRGPGHGWPGQGDYFWVKNSNQSVLDYQKAMYFAEGATCTVADGASVKQGDQIGKAVQSGGTGAPGNFEIGPANPGTGDCLAKDYGLGSRRAYTMVTQYARWLQSLGAGSPTSTGNAGAP